MNSKGRRGSAALIIALVVVIVLAVAGGIWYYEVHQSSLAQPSSSVGATSLSTSSTAWITYRSDDYGFSVSYPPDWTIQDNSVDMSCQRDSIVIITSPARYDLPGYQGIPVHYIILISEGAGTVADFGGSTSTFGNQSPWNLDPSKYNKEQTPEYAIGQQIIASFAQGAAKPSSSTFQQFYNGTMSFNFPCGWDEGAMPTHASYQPWGVYALCSPGVCQFNADVLTEGTPTIEVYQTINSLVASTPTGAVKLGSDSQGDAFFAELNDPSSSDALNEIMQSFKIGTSSTP